jgi:hypothetical protein
MTPAGYMAKKVVKRPDWIRAPSVEDIYSLSGCISAPFADYIKHWKHNGYWLFNSVDAIRTLASEHGIPLTHCKIFYYEVFDQEYDDDRMEWRPFAREASFGTAVVLPVRKQLEGYDVVTFTAHTSPECSPLSCNNLAAAIRTNSHCLLTSFEDARARIEAGGFERSEPGPFRIFAVYSLPD